MQNNVLTAREGYIYTNGETFGYTIRLGANDSADNWHEVPEDEYENLLNNNYDYKDRRG